MDYHDRIENLNEKPLREFVKGDTIYISKNESGYQIMYYCEFLRLDRGRVIAKVIAMFPKFSKFHGGDIISARANKCCLWGRYPDEYRRWSFFWFHGLDKKAGEE